MYQKTIIQVKTVEFMIYYIIIWQLVNVMFADIEK